MVAISSMFHWNSGSILSVYMASHSRRQQISLFTGYDHTWLIIKIMVASEKKSHSFVDGHKYFREMSNLILQHKREDSNL
jgi:hypothetical protein